MDCMYRSIYSRDRKSMGYINVLLSVFELLKYRDDVFVVIGICGFR
jgi:hypothetical protein